MAPPSTTLRRRLRRVEALKAGATTAGEREAASRAEARLRRRLDTHPHTDPRPTGPPQPSPASPHLSWPGSAPGAVLPDVESIRRVLEGWADRRLDRDAVRRWAERIVDRVLLPDAPPSDPVSVRVEVIMELSARGPGAITHRDLPPLQRFLLHGQRDPAGAWRGWFAWRAGRRLGAT